MIRPQPQIMLLNKAVTIDMDVFLPYHLHGHVFELLCQKKKKAAAVRECNQRGHATPPTLPPLCLIIQQPA